MAKFKIKKKLKDVQKNWMDIVIEQINHGKVLPIISNVVSNELIFGSHDNLVDGWAEYIEYPLSEYEQQLRDILAKLPDASPEWELYVDMAFRNSLAQTTQFQSVMSQAGVEVGMGAGFIKKTYLEFLQEVLYSIANEDLLEEVQADTVFSTLSFSEIAHRLNYPSFETDRKNPLLLLADLPLPIYLTTGYHNFIETALTLAGKKPRTEICRWNESVNDLPLVFETEPNYEPSPEEPLVYHLHGLDAEPTSLVLTEDDYLDFLATISKNKTIIPLPVRQALADSSLLLLGYDLRHWDFKVIFRGLIKPTDNSRRPASISIQLENMLEKEYLKHYLKQEARFGVYWGTAGHFMQELWASWEAQH
jgi:hypothetical protein